MPKTYGNIEIWGDLLVTGTFSIIGFATCKTVLTQSEEFSELDLQCDTIRVDEPLLFVLPTTNVPFVILPPWRFWFKPEYKCGII